MTSASPKGHGDHGRVLRRDALRVVADDPRLAPALPFIDGFPFQPRGSGFTTLLRLILEQQVSVQAAEAMWRKLGTVLRPITPEGVLALPADTLRACGFSRQKMRYAAGLADAAITGSIDFQAIDLMADEQAIDALIKLNGVGTWTAECYLLFGLGRPDILPAKDLALMVGWQMLAGLDTRPSPQDLIDVAQAWRPRRTAASFLIWHYYVARQKARKLPS